MSATVGELAAAAHTIVIGVVAAVDDSVLIRSGNTIAMPEKGVPHWLDIERVYKGDSGPSLAVYQRWVEGAPNLQVGERWLLFLHVDGFGNLTAGPCTPSTRLPPGAEPSPALAAALGESRAPSVTVGGRLGQILTMVIAAAVAGLFLLWRVLAPEAQRLPGPP